MALLQLAHRLNAVSYGIELSEDRAAIVRESLPEGQALAPVYSDNYFSGLTTIRIPG
jgi:hypothetical protein